MGDSPDFVAVGHVTRDLTERGRTAGGAALYAAVTVSRLGWRVGLLTRGAPSEAREFLDSLDVVVDKPSEEATTFEMRYSGDKRTQKLLGSASSIEVGMLPESWREAKVVLLGPVFQEVPLSMSERFPKAILGVAPQGWLRQAEPGGYVEHTDWYEGDVLGRADVVTLSELDVADGRIPERWLEHDGIFVLTKGRWGALMRCEGGWYDVPAYPAREVDPTGAGDVFAAAFLIRYFETKDALEAGLFASCAASLQVAREGVEAIPTREQIEARMSRYPDLRVEAVEAGAGSSDSFQE